MENKDYVSYATYAAIFLENKALKKENGDLKLQLQNLTNVKDLKKTNQIKALGSSRWAEYTINGKKSFRREYTNVKNIKELSDVDKKLIEVILAFQLNHNQFKMRYETIAEILNVDYPTIQVIVGNLKKIDVLTGNLDELGGSLNVNLDKLVSMITPDDIEVNKPTCVIETTPKPEKIYNPVLLRYSKAFVDKANSIHNSKYDYSEMDYVNVKQNITIICPEHGKFQQMPKNHLLGSGCQECGKIKRKETIDGKKVHVEKPPKKPSRNSKESFVAKANVTHDSFYDYSLVDYKGSIEKVTIICPIHGNFEQLPTNHVAGSGCQRCAIERRNELIHNQTPEHILHSTEELSDDFNDFLRIITNLNK